MAADSQGGAPAEPAEPAAPGLPVCAADAVLEGGRGVRFPVTAFGAPATGFVVRFEGRAYAYLNRCAHVPIELDWAEGEFFESSGLYLMCATHGAVYLPETGHCAGGPCKGGRLRPIALREEGGVIYWQPDQFVKAPAAHAAPGA
ncbi:Rieske (2Fe-2S) protein [Massilia glaciei]|uniref:Rieske (2Fe-2S) protein n=1 Tax=Massilia glaciei TaxID=1524097 RepID=A0A2U2HP42_9BURK|nr:Rieske 2Fe-2S domain-containing protein [Massilia glaciei]PWF49185.1 Rieske (2Fe-2S) protein [Massilia glaciei]